MGNLRQSMTEEEWDALSITNDPKDKLCKKEMVNHPDHYGGNNPLEVINVIEHYGLGFCLGNTIKYVLRAGKKDNVIQDLEKARWYLDREIESLKKTQ